MIICYYRYYLLSLLISYMNVRSLILGFSRKTFLCIIEIGLIGMFRLRIGWRILGEFG